MTLEREIGIRRIIKGIEGRNKMKKRKGICRKGKKIMWEKEMKRKMIIKGTAGREIMNEKQKIIMRNKGRTEYCVGKESE